MCGGNEEDFSRAQPVIDCYARSVVLLGEVGSGQLTKMVNQICIAGLLQGLSEGLNFAARSGLDTDKVVEVISKGAAGSWQMENRGSTMSRGEFDFGFAVQWMRKDLLGRGQEQWRPPASNSPRRSVLRASSSAWRQSLGYLQPYPFAG